MKHLLSHMGQLEQFQTLILGGYIMRAPMHFRLHLAMEEMGA